MSSAPPFNNGTLVKQQFEPKQRAHSQPKVRRGGLAAGSFDIEQINDFACI
jgi:hypothetical protein